MLYMDCAILMLDQNTTHPNVPHTFGYSAKPSKRSAKTITIYHHTQTQTSYPTHHWPSHPTNHLHDLINMYHDLQLPPPHGPSHCSSQYTSYLSGMLIHLIPEVEGNNHTRMNMMIHQWSILRLTMLTQWELNGTEVRQCHVHFTTIPPPQYQ